VARAARPRIGGGCRADAANVAGWPTPIPAAPPGIPVSLIEKSEFRAAISRIMKSGALGR